MDATQAIILCAGLQKSYAYEDSKFMFDIAGRPAFSYTMESILEVFPESAVTIITSQRFQDFNAFINQAYPTATVAFDDNPGSGTALSLKKATPFKKLN
ncbi:MAG TPA: hypothetical protein DEF47_15840 [Herpetosiphon sp.]|uniref:MobA-like NTP transferase domain-containing protein n=1 Tax=Herpetosiphon aurantiacus (strain ATCC 23779 / DSM 785 / 114-95) TaxID=316274 RepID=A9B4P9_HERA2|nr:hypothetical protein [Herpetosiphon sp.]ABX04214.1 hypothetical protein Haur_1571 [Herpetosiphon aurantiacus DSM 785]HBW51365.1 hypothetical protein [Herpetosiphon sp.]